jgi:hypothetical protein
MMRGLPDRTKTFPSTLPCTVKGETTGFPGWQQTIAGDREVKQALRKTLLKYKLHQDQDLFDRAYEYVKQYY